MGYAGTHRLPQYTQRHSPGTLATPPCRITHPTTTSTLPPPLQRHTTTLPITTTMTGYTTTTPTPRRMGHRTMGRCCTPTPDAPPARRHRTGDSGPTTTPDATTAMPATDAPTTHKDAPRTPRPLRPHARASALRRMAPDGHFAKRRSEPASSARPASSRPRTGPQATRRRLVEPWSAAFANCAAFFSQFGIRRLRISPLPPSKDVRRILRRAPSTAAGPDGVAPRMACSRRRWRTHHLRHGDPPHVRPQATAPVQRVHHLCLPRRRQPRRRPHRAHDPPTRPQVLRRESYRSTPSEAAVRSTTRAGAAALKAASYHHAAHATSSFTSTLTPASSAYATPTPTTPESTTQ